MIKPRTVPQRATVNLADAQLGDRVYVHSNKVVSRLIQGAQWIRWRAGSKWNHMFILVKPMILNGVVVDWVIVQAATRGVSYSTLLAETEGAEYAIVSAEGLDRNKVVEFATAQVGVKYGFLTLFAIAINLYTPSIIHIDFRRDGTWICSAMAEEASRFGGLYRPWKNIYGVSPAEAWIEESV